MNKGLIEMSPRMLRFKGFHFEEAGLGFELPKHLAVSDVAVRILHTRYDLLSLLARSADPGANASPRYACAFLKAKWMLCCFDVCHPLSPRSQEDDAELPAPEVDVNTEGEEEKEEQQENKDGENPPSQESTGKKVHFCWFEFK